ncbi:SAM-dependent methyltransferase, partial [Ralstonia pseudosolanacearum]
MAGERGQQEVRPEDHHQQRRAAYKLKEIDEQDKLIRPGQVIVDLG